MLSVQLAQEIHIRCSKFRSLWRFTSDNSNKISINFLSNDSVQGSITGKGSLNISSLNNYQLIANAKLIRAKIIDNYNKVLPNTMT